MAATSTCATPIKGTHLRIIALDACGVPVTGTPGLVGVSTGFVQVQMEPDYEDGEEFFERTASGQPCVNQKDDPTLKRMGLTVQMCEINASLIAYIISARELTTGTPTTGTGFASTPTARNQRFQRSRSPSSGSRATASSGLPATRAAEAGEPTATNGVGPS